MRQNLKTIKAKIHVYLTYRIRPVANLKKVFTRALGQMGPMARKPYVCCIEREIRSELRWLKRKNRVTNNYFDLMPVYPKLKRAFFIHIPKCGGTSIRQNLVESYGVAPIPLTSPGTIRQSVRFMVSSVYRRGILKAIGSRSDIHEQDTSQRATYLRALVAFMIATNPRYFFILGHQRAKELIPLYRGAPDLIFSTVREPVAMLRSLVNYRVFHILANQNRQDSKEILAALNCTFDEFNVLLESEPEALVFKILSANKASLASYLSLDGNTDPNIVWSGICDHDIYIAHVSEQDDLQKALFGKSPRTLHKNATDTSADFIELFNARLQDEWIRPHVDSDSSALYERFVEYGIIGFWKDGGSPESYRRLLRET